MKFTENWIFVNPFTAFCLHHQHRKFSYCQMQGFIPVSTQHQYVYPTLSKLPWDLDKAGQTLWQRPVSTGIRIYSITAITYWLHSIFLLSVHLWWKPDPWNHRLVPNNSHCFSLPRHIVEANCNILGTCKIQQTLVRKTDYTANTCVQSSYLFC